MASTGTTRIKKDKEREKKERERKEKAPPHTERLKTVVRKLPPNLPEEIFWQSVQTWVTDESVTWKAYYPGKFRSRLNKENIPSRAYIAFKNEEQLAVFSREYDGHLFRDKSGNESQAVVEFAPYQKVPSEKKKADARVGTIETDENYISFIESLAASANPEPLSIEALIASTQQAPQPKTTPLLEALKAEKAAAVVREKSTIKDKVAIMRNTAHDASKKDDVLKKKGGKSATESAASSPPQNKKALHSKKPVPPAVASSTPGGPSARSTGPQSTKASKTSSRQTSSAASKVSTTNSSSAALPPPASSSSTPSESQSQADPPSSSSRRSRPIIGLASRQFEAALSGAGVNSGERKFRRERERAREREREGATGEEKDSKLSSVSGGAKDPSSTTAPTANQAHGTSRQATRSPNRDRGGRRKNSMSGGGGGGGGGGLSALATPKILQRSPAATDGSSASASGSNDSPPAILQRGGGGGDDSPSVTPLTPIASEGVTPSFRGGRRGRGRGGKGGGGTPRSG